MATVSTKRQRTEKSMKVKYEALKELEKGVPHKDVAARFGVPKNTLSTWKKNKAKIIESYESGLGVKRVRPETYEVLNKEINRGVDKEEQCTKNRVPITDFFKEINCTSLFITKNHP